MSKGQAHLAKAHLGESPTAQQTLMKMDFERPKQENYRIDKKHEVCLKVGADLAAAHLGESPTAHKGEFRKTWQQSCLQHTIEFTR
jgi:hypothetical protein